MNINRVSPTMSKTFSTNDVSSHNKPDSLWIIVDEDVYDLTKFQDDHPGEPNLDPKKPDASKRAYFSIDVIFRWPATKHVGICTH